MPIASVNPFTGVTLQTFEPIPEREIARRILNAHNAFQEYRRIPLAERSRMMARAADVLEQHRDEFARLEIFFMKRLLAGCILIATHIGCFIIYNKN